MDNIFRVTFFIKPKKRVYGTSRFSNWNDEDSTFLKDSRTPYSIQKSKIFANMALQRGQKNTDSINLEYNDHNSVNENNKILYRTILKNTFNRKSENICKDTHSLNAQISKQCFFNKNQRKREKLLSHKDKFVNSLRCNNDISNLSNYKKIKIMCPSQNYNTIGKKINKVSIKNVSLPNNFDYKIPSLTIRKSPIQISLYYKNNFQGNRNINNKTDSSNSKLLHNFDLLIALKNLKKSQKDEYNNKIQFKNTLLMDRKIIFH